MLPRGDFHEVSQRVKHQTYLMNPSLVNHGALVTGGRTRAIPISLRGYLISTPRGPGNTCRPVTYEARTLLS